MAAIDCSPPWPCVQGFSWAEQPVAAALDVPILYAGLASFLYGQAQRSMGPFREHLYILSLITLIDRHILQALPQGHQGPPEPSQASSPMGASTSSAQRATFPGAANLPGPAPTLDQALEIVRVHG